MSFLSFLSLLIILQALESGLSPSIIEGVCYDRLRQVIESIQLSVWLFSLKYFLNRTVRYRHLRLKCIKSALESAGTKRSRNWTYYFDWTVSVSNYSKKDSSDHDSQVYHVSILDVAVAAASLVVAYCLNWLWVFQIWRIVWFP